MNSRAFLATLFLFFACASATGQTQNVVIRENLKPLPNEALDLMIGQSAVINNPDSARRLIALLNVSDESKRCSDGSIKLDPTGKDTYSIIHVLYWGDPTGQGNEQKQQVQAQKWYVYHNGDWSQEDFTTAKRIFGVKQVWLLFVHLNLKPAMQDYRAHYEIDIKKKAPAPISNLFAVAQLFLPGGAELARAVENYWGAGCFKVNYVPSDITVTPKYLPNDAGPLDAPTALGNPETFDNEGRYWWDVSVGVPIRRISQLEFDSTANTVTAKKVDKQNIFAFLNLFPKPRDVKGTNFSWTPHFVGGISIAKQPLHKFMIGAGWGPHFANFYIGSLWVKEDELMTLLPGSPATPAQLDADRRRRFKPQIAFGVNLPVRSIVKKLSSK